MTSQRPYRYIRQIPWELLSLCNASFARAIEGWWCYEKRMNCVLIVSLDVRYNAGKPEQWNCEVADLWKVSKPLIAGLPRARSALGTEPHTHGIWSTSFRLVVTWLTERTYVWETIKRKGGVSQACLGKSSSFIYDTHNMVNWQLSKQDSHWPVSYDHIAGSCDNS